MLSNNSTKASYSRYNFGVVRPTHKGRVTSTFLGSEKFEAFLEQVVDNVNYRTGYLPAEYAHRPDLVSNLFYNTPGYWWYLLLFNNIEDPFEGMNPGDRILIPSL